LQDPCAHLPPPPRPPRYTAKSPRAVARNYVARGTAAQGELSSHLEPAVVDLPGAWQSAGSGCGGVAGPKDETEREEQLHLCQMAESSVTACSLFRHCELSKMVLY